jgi:hypothetical protein
MKLISTIYAIRQKSTGYFLPTRWGTARGYSFDNPTPNCVPRIFKSRNSANKALTAWLQGEWKNTYCRSDWSGDEIAGVSPDKVEGRDRNDMEVVELSILDVSISELANVQL